MWIFFKFQLWLFARLTRITKVASSTSFLKGLRVCAQLCCCSRLPPGLCASKADFQMLAPLFCIVDTQKG